MRLAIDVDKTRAEIRRQMQLWGTDASEFEVVWQEQRDGQGRITRMPGATLRYMRGGKWQVISCYGYPSRAANLRQILFLVERLRIAEQHGVQYEGLAYSTELTSAEPEGQRKQDILEAYDILGISPDDPLGLIDDVYRKKSMYYHPDKADKGGTDEKFKRLNAAYELIKKNRG